MDCRVYGFKLAVAFAVAFSLTIWLPTAGGQDLTKPPPEPPARYYVMELHDVVGQDITNRYFLSDLAAARKLGAEVIVLDLDSPGGSVAEAEAIVKSMLRTKDVRFVAFVRKALSAAVPICMACDKIFVTREARIGAATSYLSVQGIPKVIAEKYQSAWRALCRTAADFGKHPSILAEAMIDTDFALTIREENGKPVLERNGTGKVIKARGRLLTLTAQEAIDFGLAASLVERHDELGKKLAISKPWQQVRTPYQEARHLAESLAGDAISNEKWAAVDRVLTRYAKEHNVSAEFWFWTGVYRYRADDTGRAIGAFRRAIRLRPDFSLAHAYIGIAYEVKKDPVNALKAYRKTIAVEPQFSFAWRKIGWLHFQAKRYADSAKAFGEYVELEPGSAFGHYCLGAAYHESHQYDKAVTSLERALEMGVDRDTASDVLYRLRLIRRKRGF